MFGFNSDKMKIVSADDALAGRETPIATAQMHHVFETPLKAPRSDEHDVITFGMGCFWGVERIFWAIEGVVNTSVGYSAGYTPNPTYQEVCTGKTGHNEVVQITFDPHIVSVEELLKAFWENHDPTQGMGQGNDRGTQYRSGVYFHSQQQKEAAQASKAKFQEKLTQAGFGVITTEILPAGPYYFAEDYHQQYLAKNPNGYCGIGGVGVSCPIGLVE